MGKVIDLSQYGEAELLSDEEADAVESDVQAARKLAEGMGDQPWMVCGGCLIVPHTSPRFWDAFRAVAEQ